MPFQRFRARRNGLLRAKLVLVQTQFDLTEQIPNEADVAKRAVLAKHLADIHDGIEAIQMAGGKSLSRRALWLSSLSTLLAIVALFFNTSAWYSQEDAKRADASITWCAKLFDPNYVGYQSIVRELKEPNSASRLPSGLTLAKLNSSGPSGGVDETTITALVVNIDKVIPAPKDPKPDLYASLIGLLNLIEVGSAMVLQGDMEGHRLVNCFRDFADAYHDRFDYSYVGLKYATLNREPGKKLGESLEIFPNLACVFYKKNCDKAADKLSNKKIVCRPSSSESEDFCEDAHWYDRIRRVGNLLRG
ncbi:hypothetical protein ACVMB1_000141 [Bradyrhizobium sp. USDA 4504]